MPIEILMPALSPTMEEGVIAKWFVKEGDKINPGDILAEIETDKAIMEFEAVDEGTIGKIFVPEGDIAVKVNEKIAILLTHDESLDQSNFKTTLVLKDKEDTAALLQKAPNKKETKGKQFIDFEERNTTVREGH